MVNFRKSCSILLLVIALSHNIADDSKDISTQTPVTTSSKPSANSEIKSRIAFLVGINSYKATTSLKYAVGDSEAIEDLLLRTGKYDKLIKLNDYGKITTILNPETLSYSSQRIKMAPTKVNIEATYQEVLAENPDTLLFYYSGHGFIEGEGGENFIAPKDVDVKFEKKKVGKEEKQVPVPLNGISLKVMGVQATKVKRVVFLIDACRSPLPEADGEEEIAVVDSGKKELSSAKEADLANATKATKTIKSSKNTEISSSEVEVKKESVRKIISIRTEVLPKRILEAEGITMLIGAAPEVSSLEDEDFKSGIFTHFLKKAFNGGVQEENQEEYITEENLSRYIEDRFKQYYELRKKETELAAEPKLYNLTFDRGKKGELLLTYHRPIEGMERIDKPIYIDTIRKREVKGKLLYNEKGEREDLRFFVHDKKRDLYYPDSLDGVYKMEYGFKKDKTGELENFTATEFNLENEEVFQYGTKLIPDVGWEYRGLYAQTDEDKKSKDRSQIQFEAKVYDWNGNNISEEYFDSKGQPLEFENVSKTVRAFDKDGQKILEEFYGKDTLDEYGDVTKKGDLIEKKGKWLYMNGYARYKAQYKSKGNLLLETWEDKTGKVTSNEFGYSKIKYVYDKKNRLTKKVFYNEENKLKNDKSGVATYQYYYNKDCIRYYESQINIFRKDQRPKAYKEWELGKYKLCLAEEIHLNENGRPVKEENQYYKEKRKFNKKGLLISEESFLADGRRYLLNGVAQVVYLYDKNDNIISKRNFGEISIKKELIPIFDQEGIHEYRYSYLDYYRDGTPFLNECMYHRKDKGILIKPYGCALKIEHFGINGKPIENKHKVFRTNIYYTGAYQEEADRHYYTLDIQNIKVEKGAIIRNRFGSETLSAEYKQKEGVLVLDRKIEYKYDERNNNTLEVMYNTGDGKETLFSRSERKYDERNNKTLFAYYLEKEDKEVLRILTEYKYDERNNETLVSLYNTEEEKKEIVTKLEYKYDKRNNMILKEEYNTRDGKKVLEEKNEYKYDERNNVTLIAIYGKEKGKVVLNKKQEYKYDERNNKTLSASYETRDGALVLDEKYETKYDERNNETLVAKYKTKEGKEVLVSKTEYKFDERNNKTLEAKYETREGKEVLVSKTEYKFDERNNKTLYAQYQTKDGKEVLVSKSEFKFDERNNETLSIMYLIRDKMVWKDEYEYDERNNLTLWTRYITRDGKENFADKEEYKYDEKNNMTLKTIYELRNENEVAIDRKLVNKYDDRNNKTLEAKYKLRDGNEFLVSKLVWKYDESNNLTFEAEYKGDEETVMKIFKLEYRVKSLSPLASQFESQIKDMKTRLKKIEDDNDNLNKKESQIKSQLQSEKKTLNEKLEALNKEYEAKQKKYFLSLEKFGENEKLESASYKLLFYNPRGPFDKRLMRVDLDKFYRPVKVGFEEE